METAEVMEGGESGGAAVVGRDFHVLDELRCGDGDGAGGGATSSEEGADTDTDDEVRPDEIDAMLDAGLPQELRASKRLKNEDGSAVPAGGCLRPAYEEKEKIVLQEVGRNHFEVLPEGWVQVTHNSGMPVYLHKPTRVCTLAKPYFLGPGSARKHAVPISAVPCLHYRRATEQTLETPTTPAAPTENSAAPESSAESSAPTPTPTPAPTPTPTPTNGGLPCARIESVAENALAHSLSAVQLRDYCTKVFRFRTVRLMRFKTWAARRKHTKMRKQRQAFLSCQMPAGSSNSSVVAVPLPAHLPDISGDVSDDVSGVEGGGGGGGGGGDVDDEDDVDDDDGGGVAAGDSGDAAATAPALGRPTLPRGTKLITFPVASHHSTDSGGARDRDDAGVATTATSAAVGAPRREWIMNPAGKSYVCILHEYVQHALKKQPCYQFKEIENAATPYSATVLINAMQYGTGVGSSKKAAKAEAARATLEVLIPQMKEKILNETEPGVKGPTHQSDADLSFFDEIRIEDPRVAELCAKTSEPSPYAILLTCLQRNFGLGDKNVKYELRTLKHQRNEVVMTVGKHTVQVACKNKRDGKQRAAQAILQALHPHICSWGSLLRLYGSHSLKTVKEKKQEEQQITLLQSKGQLNAPNHAILEKLRLEMRKIKQSREALLPIGRFVPPDDIGLPTSSGSDLNNVDL